MDKMEQRIAVLEKRVRTLSYVICFIGVFLCGTIVFGKISFENYATAQQIRRDTPEVYTSSIPASQQNGVLREIKAQAFVLVDNKGRTRGMWSAENNNTTLGLGFVNKDPSVVLSVGEDYASLSVNSKDGKRVAISSDDKFRSIAVTDDKEGNRVFVGASDKETVAELTGEKDVRLSLNAKNEANIQTVADKSIVVAAEKKGSFVKINADKEQLNMVFADKSHKENISMKVENENPVINITSPLYKARRVISVDKNENADK